MKKTIPHAIPQRPWQSYPGENFDRTTTMALQIVDEARANGRVEPAHGYSRGDWETAEERLVRSAKFA